jgi:DNA-binding CsgD family transcriptional regulator
MSGVVGREVELRVAEEFLGRLQGGPAGLVFEGPPGIGKTTVWAGAVARAGGEFWVLSARPAEAEAGLAFGALADLLEPVPGGVFEQLPTPQRHGLAVALLREEPGPRPVDQRSVAAATLSVLRALAATRPVLLAVDDLQWLDPSSAHVLGFAIRRLGTLPVGVLACLRAGEGRAVSFDPGSALAGGRCARVTLGPLSLAALHGVLKEQLGRSLPRRSLARIMDATGGNPFFAIELARSLPEDAPVAAAWELPASLRGLVQDRITGLPKRVRDVLLAAAAAGTPTVDLVTSAMPGRPAAALRALDRAAAAGLITVDGARIRFSHPLFAAGVYWSARPSERRWAHRRLAPLVDDVEEKARHLALGSPVPDARLAPIVAAAAEHARRRGAPEIAADLAEHAHALTPPHHAAEHQRRSIQVAEYQFHAGQLREAREILREVLRRAPPGADRADALRLLGEIRYHEDSFPEAIRLFEQALEQAGNDLTVRCAIQLSLAYGLLRTGDFAAAPPHGRRAVDLAEQAGDLTSLAEALAVLAMADFLLGRGLDEAKIERALRLEDPYRQIPVQMRPSLIAGYLALYEGKLHRSTRILKRLRGRIIEGGQDSDLPMVSTYLSWSACWRGALPEAEDYAAEAIEAASRIQADSLRCVALAFAAVSAAYAGDPDMTRGRAQDCMALAAHTGDRVIMLWAGWALGLLALSQDNPQTADAELGPLTAMFEDHVPDPIRAFFLPDHVEALVALGRLDQAGRLLAAFGEAARRLERPWALMLAARCHALLHAARGDLERASTAAREALSWGAELELRIEVARTLLIAGRVERRRKSKQAAAGHLQQALEMFQDAGARLWAQRARTELGRVGLRRAAPGLLTAAERQVAELAASGRTNREVAAQLFISTKTVEANLARVYRKLGIASRAELGAKIGPGHARTQT